MAPPPPPSFQENRRKAVALLSGGLDSATTLAIALRDGFEVSALTFRYGQRHSAEIEAARRVVRAAGVRRHEIAEIDLTIFGGSALTADIPVPKDRDLSQAEGEIPVTYVPARNTIFLSYALAFAEVIESTDIFLGVNALDYSGYPDCRPEYIAAFERMANLATRTGVEGTTPLRIHTPLISLTKAEIVRLGNGLGVPYADTVSCYDPDADGTACGRCDACQLRLRGFKEAGLSDPVRYSSQRAGTVR
jgi:7-cyano-7-deazaguanine synthase